MSNPVHSGLVGSWLVLGAVSSDSEGLQDKVSQLCDIASYYYLNYIKLRYMTHNSLS